MAYLLGRSMPTRRGDRAKVAGGQKYELSYEAKKTGRSAASVKKAVKKVGNARKKVEKKLARQFFVAGVAVRRLRRRPVIFSRRSA
jgi:hypothetical protein